MCIEFGECNYTNSFLLQWKISLSSGLIHYFKLRINHTRDLHLLDDVFRHTTKLEGTDIANMHTRV